MTTHAHHDHAPHAPGAPSCGHDHAEKPAPDRPAIAGAKYTCPMHPEIVRDAPGDCPICGMALVPIAGTGEADDSRAARPHAALLDRRRPFDSAGVSRHGAHGRLSRAVRPRAAGARLDRVRARHARRAVGRLAHPAQVLAVAHAPRAEHVHADRPRRVRSRTSSVLRRCSCPACSRRSSAMHDGAVGTYFEAAAVIVTLVLLGDVLQLRAMGRTSQAISELLRLAPNLAWRVREDGSEEAGAARKRSGRRSAAREAWREDPGRRHRARRVEPRG